MCAIVEADRAGNLRKTNLDFTLPPHVLLRNGCKALTEISFPSSNTGKLICKQGRDNKNTVLKLMLKLEVEEPVLTVQIKENLIMAK